VIPTTLTQLDRWAYSDNDKAPRQPSGAYANIADPTTWSKYEDIAGLGIGAAIAITPDAHVVVVDLDGCIDEGGNVHPAAQKLVSMLNSYTEISVSGRGLHVVMSGSKPPVQKPWTKIALDGFVVEMFDSHFVTLTGTTLPGTPTDVESRQHEITEVYFHVAELASRTTTPVNGDFPAPISPKMSDEEVVACITSSTKASEFARLMTTRPDDFEDASKADVQLLGLIAFWTQDPEQIVRIGSGSLLAGRVKGNGVKWEREDYLERTLHLVLDDREEKDCYKGAATKPVVDVDALRLAATPILELADPLDAVRDAIRARYAGDITAPLITYVAVTSRLLARRLGALPAHLGLIAASSAGKSYTEKTVRRLLPDDVVLAYEAGSPKVLVYDARDLRHKVVIFGEADSLPSGEDNPAASAIRNLLQDGDMVYDVVEQGKDGKFATRHIHRPGPTVLITTSTRAFGPSSQLGTRLFEMEVPEDADKVRASLLVQAALLNAPPDEDDNGTLVAFQAYLQSLAPWDVDVPFARDLAVEVGRNANNPRLQRDFSRLLAFTQSVAILRHVHRRRDDKGRLVATLDDYRTVRELVGPMYETAVSGATESVRKVVAAVWDAGDRVTTVQAAKLAKVPLSTAKRALKTAVEHGWLLNDSLDRRAYLVKHGDPIPERCVLPIL
jgi:hypothetical protein